MEQVQQELIRSNEMLAVQVWVLGGLVSFLLVVLIALAKSAWADVRKVIDDHENRITDLETFKNRKDGLTLIDTDSFDYLTNHVTNDGMSQAGQAAADILIPLLP